MTVARLSTSTKCGNVCAGCLCGMDVKFCQAQFQLASPVHKRSIEKGVRESCKYFNCLPTQEKLFENAMYFLDKKRVKRKHFKGVKEARKEGALGLQIPASETRANLGSIAKRILKLGKNQKKPRPAQKWPPPVVTG